MFGKEKISNQIHKKQNPYSNKGIGPILDKNGQHVLVNAEQFRSIIEPEGVKMEDELRNEVQGEAYYFVRNTEQNMIGSDNEPFKETDEGNKLKPKSPIRRNQEIHEEKQCRFPSIIRSTRATKRIRPSWFREV